MYPRYFNPKFNGLITKGNTYFSGSSSFSSISYSKNSDLSELISIPIAEQKQSNNYLYTIHYPTKPIPNGRTSSTNSRWVILTTAMTRIPSNLFSDATFFMNPLNPSIISINNNGDKGHPWCNLLESSRNVDGSPFTNIVKDAGSTHPIILLNASTPSQIRNRTRRMNTQFT